MRNTLSQAQYVYLKMILIHIAERLIQDNNQPIVSNKLSQPIEVSHLNILTTYPETIVSKTDNNVDITIGFLVEVFNQGYYRIGDAPYLNHMANYYVDFVRPLVKRT